MKLSTADLATEKLAVSDPVPPSIVPVIVAVVPRLTVSFPPPSKIAVPLSPVTEPFTVTMSALLSVSIPSATPDTDADVETIIVDAEPSVCIPSDSDPLPTTSPLTLISVVPEPPPLKWSDPIVRKTEDQRWPLRDPSLKRLS